jgi:putative MATE family efflux protein
MLGGEAREAQRRLSRQRNMVERRTHRLENLPVGRLLLENSLPAIAGMVIGSLYMALDRAFLGRVVGADAIAGVSVCMPLGFVLMAFGTLVGVGSGALVSIRLGQKRVEDAEATLGNALGLIAVLSLSLSAGLLLLLERILGMLGASAATLPHASAFMQVILSGSIFQYLSFGLNAVIRAEGSPRTAMVTMMINAGLNVVLDALFILGLGFGVRGAAVATVISQAASALWTLGYFLSPRSTLKLRLRNLRLRWEILRPMLAIGLSPFTMHLAASVTTMLINRRLASYGGDVAVAAYGVIGALTMLMLMAVFGITQGAQPIIGYNFGAGRVDRVRRTLGLALVAATGIVAVGALVIQLLPFTMFRLFVRDPALVAVGAHGVRICLALAPFVGFQVVSAQFFQAIGRASVSLVLSLMRQVILLLPLLLILPPIYGLDGVWSAMPLADGLACVLTALVLARQLAAFRSWRRGS